MSAGPFQLKIFSAVQTMDSREIAALTGKAHDKVTFDIEAQLGQIGDVAAFRDIYLDSMNRKRNCYKLPYRETMILVSGYSVELRARVVDRWLELERAARLPALPDFSDPVKAARAWADEFEAKQKAERALEIAAPKIALAEAIGASERCMSITDAAKLFGLHPKLEVFPYLRHAGYLTEKDLPTQAALDAGYLALKETKSQDGRVWPQAVVETWQLEKWRAHVVHQVKHFAAKTVAV